MATAQPPNVQQVLVKYAGPSPQELAALKIQRWFKSRMRRIRFIKTIRRAVRRRRYLDERRSLATRIHTREVETEEMKAKLMMDRGHRLVEEWNDARTAKAAKMVQTMWRKMIAKRRMKKVAGKMNQEAALRRIQVFVRKWRQKRQPNLLLLAAQENPAARPITHERLFKHEEQMLKKKTAYIPDVTGDAMAQALRMEELRRKAEEKYRGFLASRPQERAEIARTYLHREQTKQMISALDGRGWDRPLPYGVCSAALLKEAEKRHEERKAEFAREIWAGGVNKHTGNAIEAATLTVAVESCTEAAENDQLLWGLEADLGYDFSEQHSKEPLPASAKPPDTALFQPSSAGGYGRLVR